MSTNTQLLIIIYLSVCVSFMSSGLIKFKYLKYCGPPDKTFKYKITPWPVLRPGQVVNVLVTFTPAVDIFASTLRSEVISKKDHQIIFRDARDVPCSKIPKLCNLAGGETYSLSFNIRAMVNIPPGLKGTFTARLELYNQDQVMWVCAEAEVVL
ncbi:hypothetical protein ACROYT_G000642 [Oculina patagonica]